MRFYILIEQIKISCGLLIPSKHNLQPPQKFGQLLLPQPAQLVNSLIYIEVMVILLSSSVSILCVHVSVCR